MSYRSRNESVISCMQDVENMMQESKKKKKRNKFNRLKLFRNPTELNKEKRRKYVEPNFFSSS